MGVGSLGQNVRTPDEGTSYRDLECDCPTCNKSCCNKQSPAQMKKDNINPCDKNKKIKVVVNQKPFDLFAVIDQGSTFYHQE